MGTRRFPLDGRRLFLAGASAVLHTLALPPWDLSGLAWVALVPLLLALRGLSSGGGALLGLIWGTLAIWGIGWWVPGALAHYYQQPIWFGALFALVASVLVLGVYGALFGACVARLGGSVAAAARPFAVAALWVSCELARSWPWTTNPWLLLGYALVPSETLAQAADLGGVYGLSFAIVAVNASLAAFTQARFDAGSFRDAWRRLLPAVAVLLALAVYGRIRVSIGTPAGTGIDVAAVQADVDLGWQWSEALHGAGLDRYLDLSHATLEAGRVDLLVWPESAVTALLADEPPFRRAIARELLPRGADLVTGGPFVADRGSESDDARYHNSAFYLTSDGTIVSRYDKVRLLPFGEYFPLRAIELLQRRFERLRSFTPGLDPAPLETRFGRIAVVICFEAIFPDLVREQMRRGARLLVNLSNDAWLGSGPGPAQHFAMARLRAVENRTWLVRATTTGISAVVDPLGRVVDRVGSDTVGVARARVRLAPAASPYLSLGDAFAWSCVAISLLLLARSKRAAQLGP